MGFFDLFKISIKPSSDDDFGIPMPTAPVKKPTITQEEAVNKVINKTAAAAKDGWYYLESDLKKYLRDRLNIQNKNLALVDFTLVLLAMEYSNVSSAYKEDNSELMNKLRNLLLQSPFLTSYGAYGKKELLSYVEIYESYDNKTDESYQKVMHLMAERLITKMLQNKTEILDFDIKKHEGFDPKLVEAIYTKILLSSTNSSSVWLGSVWMEIRATFNLEGQILPPFI